MKEELPELPFANLPTILRKGMEPFPSTTEKTIFLYGALTVLSGLCVRVTGEYRQQLVRPNLFLFVLAPPASGKSALNYARKMVYKVHEAIKHRSIEQLELYYQAEKAFKDRGPASLKPPMSVVLIPANCSNAKLVEHLVANADHTPSIIVESEIDTLTVATKSEFGNFSDVLRKAFHNEAVTYSRKQNDQFLEVTEPKLALALAGTFNQFRRLITNVEDGLYSRFLVYTDLTTASWSSVAPCDSCVNLDQLFTRLAEEVQGYFEQLSTINLHVTLTSTQWNRLNEFGEQQTRLSIEAGEVNAHSFVRRHALMVFKICMTLTAIRAAENKRCVDGMMHCEDADFDSAIYLVKASLHSSLDLLSQLPGAYVDSYAHNRAEFLSKLPKSFERRTAIEIARSCNISQRTADRILAEFVKEGLLQSATRGAYKKALANWQDGETAIPRTRQIIS